MESCFGVKEKLSIFTSRCVSETRVSFGAAAASVESTIASECLPAVDVYETDETIEVVVDLPGVDPAAVRIVAKGDSLLVAGDKSPRRARGESSFHLVERGYGRFARVVRLGRACDTARARARLVGGELQISLPKIADRRGRPLTIAIT